MADSLTIFRGAAKYKIVRMRRVVERLRNGRGAHLGTLITHTLNRFEASIAELDFEVAELEFSKANPLALADLRTKISRKYERLSPQLDVAHSVLARYESAVDRPDVPIGLQHLIDVLMKEVVAQPGDPIIYLNPVYMYSTVDLVILLDDLLLRLQGMKIGESYAGPHPIAFNLPALDPDNALLSPIIAHEVAHTAVQEKLMSAVEQAAGDDPAKILLTTLGGDPDALRTPTARAWTSRFRDWTSELICDAVALAISGPSFMFAFAAFAPPTDYAFVGTHPPLRDRIEFHLKVLDALGWTQLLESECPELLAWLRDSANAKVLVGGPEEAFLRQAMTSIQPSIISVASAHVVNSILDPTETTKLLADAKNSFAAGIPNVEVGADVLSPWQVVLSGWLAALDPTMGMTFHEPATGPVDDDSTGADDSAYAAEMVTHPELRLVAAAGSRGYNAVLIKALEMSSIVNAWRAHERASA